MANDGLAPPTEMNRWESLLNPSTFCCWLHSLIFPWALSAKQREGICFSNNGEQDFYSTFEDGSFAFYRAEPSPGIWVSLICEDVLVNVTQTCRNHYEGLFASAFQLIDLLICCQPWELCRLSNTIMGSSAEVVCHLWNDTWFFTISWHFVDIL